MHLINLILFFCLLSGMVTGQSFLKTMKRLPDTGQTKSYTITFGEDHDYNTNVPYFIKHENGTVTDSITGLMWQSSDGGEMKYEKALLYADTLTLGGYADWRLPNGHELFSILNHQLSNPATDQAVFEKTGAEYWWSSELQVNDANKVWVTNAGGGIGNHSKSETISAGGTKRFHVRAVRDVETPVILPQKILDNFDGTVTDLATGLIWNQEISADSLTWENALVAAETLEYAGSRAWRLPNIKELQSISDAERINPCFYQGIFSNASIGKFWSSTTLPNQITRAWYLDSRFGITTYDQKIRRFKIILVRDVNTISSSHETLQKDAFTISIFPNPADSEIVLHFKRDDALDYQVCLINLQGQTIRSSSVHSGSGYLILDIHNVPNGVYFIQAVHSSGKIYTEKVVIHH